MSPQARPARHAHRAWVTVPLAALLTVLAWLTNRPRPSPGVEGGPPLEVLWIVFAALAIGSVVVGVVIATRVRGNPIGWLLIATGLLHGLTGVLHGHAYVVLVVGWSLPGGTLANWVASWLIVPIAVLAAFVILLFPDGRLPSSWWRWPTRAFVAVSAVYAVAGAVDAWPRRAQPILDLAAVAPAIGDGVVAHWWPMFMLLNAIPVAAVVSRYWRGRADERAQIRWLAAAFAIVAAGQALLAIDDVPVALLLAAAVGSLAVPVAIAVAVLRYRLYEIDRIISRTVAYGLVVAVLAGVYAAGVLGLGTLLSALTGVEGSDLAVAASVLAVVVLFRPLRTRVQHVVDRRFNRTGYQAHQAVEAFPDRIRDEVALDTIRDATAATATVALQPATAWVWLADPNAPKHPHDGTAAGAPRPDPPPARRP